MLHRRVEIEKQDFSKEFSGKRVVDSTYYSLTAR
jgi:hypothetical protein